MALADWLGGRLAGAVDQARADRERLEFELRMAMAARQEAQDAAERPGRRGGCWRGSGRRCGGE